GLMVEIHDDPKRALSDGPQALKPDTYLKMTQQAQAIRALVSD
ncbi:MAG: 3-deoxy-7-phosphoheptulonate synthase, partial [Liquorilactobacillus ghanensis]